MPTIKQTIQVLSVMPLFALAACGEGYEMRPYHGTPYDGRTAGAGVEYVLAKMMPKKGVVEEAAPAVVEKPKEEVKAPEPAPATSPLQAIKDAVPIFNKKVGK